MRLIATGAILLFLGMLGVPATIIAMVLAFQKLNAAGGNANPALIARYISIIVTVTPLASLLIAAGLVVVIVGIIRQRKLPNHLPPANP